MRMAYLRAMLNQDISLFDTEASTGEVIAAVTTDVIVVQDAISEKVIVNVRTVQAFAAADRAVQSYKTALLSTYSYGKKAGLAEGLGLGTLHFVLFVSWALLVWFCSIIVHKSIANGGDSFTTMLNVVVAGLSADVVAVLQNGKIVGTGSHEELITKANGAYASLVQLQEIASL
ncbi:OLC1v1031251C1 [Oldenlandia corymbosa var. corymbosa]|uniref:OLC1v1031251C1 n=1 Tax=Oldenlandia corymbosa var. corymbosa TaxID=529605 RepID=A0AAV1CIW9_OLDCO|nr:OLC1v1031251C1 [Oldenlandia corymbosa var. corymbosa]